ncbi:hypothetical protein LJB99_02865 [Deltaproteobacteria bacterium OttesenSCG-928-K17]|nr:hypothetical protein [Deltaproteobacteria bacterium OttesenSCG-928-K17]
MDALDKTKDAALTVIDLLLSGGAPVFTLTDKLISAKNEIRDHLFKARLKKMIDRTQDLTQEDRNKLEEKFKNQRERDFTYRQLILVIESINEEEKIDIIINLFRAFIYDKITIFEFRRFLFIVNNTFYHDLLWLKSMKETDEIYQNVEMAGLIPSGLLSPSNIHIGGGLSYVKNKTGKLFCEIAFS